MLAASAESRRLGVSEGGHTIAELVVELVDANGMRGDDDNKGRSDRL